LWEAASGQAVSEPLVGHSNRVTNLAFSPDGKVLVSASGDSTIRFWNVADGTPADDPLSSGSEQVWSVLQAPHGPDGVIALSGDGSIAWWNSAKDELLHPLLHTHLETEEMKGSADGSRLYLASTGPEALAVTPILAEWAQTACKIANRGLTKEEWALYMDGAPYDPACK
jgi:WD40 repeat protein